MRFRSVVAICLALLSVALAQKTTFSVDLSSGQFICPYTNRSVLFHGINAVEKIAPFVPRFADSDLQLLQTLGFNAVRLGVMWPAVEPVRGQYNYTYLNEMRDLVERLGQYGLFSIVDFHQDLLHPSLCGEGLPDFALRVTETNCTGNLVEKIASLIGGCKGIKDYGMRTDPVTGYPLVADCLKYQFSLFYPTPDVSSAFQSFYTDDDIQQWFADYWAVVADTFANSTYVLGYDLFNEPWPGMVWEDLFLLVGGFSDHKYLQPLYQKLHTSIRQNDNNHIVFYEGVQFPDTFPLFGGIVSPNGFTESPGGADYDDRQGLSYHVYCCASGADSCDTDGNPAFDARCDKYNAAKLSQRVKDAQRVNRGGGFLTEFGGCNNVPSCIREIERTANLADQYLQSWTYWSYRNFDDITTESQDEGFFYPNGTLQYEKVRSLSRTYAQATQGKLVSQSFNSTTSAYTLSFVADPSITSPTEIYLNTQYYYPNGYQYNGPPATKETNRIVIAPLKTPQTVVVTIVASDAAQEVEAKVAVE